MKIGIMFDLHPDHDLKSDASTCDQRPHLALLSTLQVL